MNPFVEGVLNKTDLTFKLNQLLESVRQKNDLNLQLGQELVEIKTELEKERKTFRAELNEQRTQRQALENSKQNVEAQLTEADRENRELLREISILQVGIMSYIPGFMADVFSYYGKLLGSLYI